jgi:DNA-directed RNA polymerase specialized sigma24 family protein
MAEGPSFEELIRRVRAWDQEAAAELVRRYEPAIRRAVRVRLADARLGNLLDSMDICQSVMRSFFVRAAASQYDLETPEQVLKLLTAMARNKLASQARKQHTLRRDNRRARAIGDEGSGLIASGDSPSAATVVRDLQQEVRRRLALDEWQLLELKNQGHDWAAIAEQVGGLPETLRKKLARAIDRVVAELGLDDEP